MPAKKNSAKKSATKKTAAPKQSLDEIFGLLLPVLKKYEPPFTQKGPPMKLGGKNGFNLWTGKEIEFMNRKFPTIHFAGLIKQSNYVGFYYMPVYANPALKKQLAPELAKMLKGKSCFHIKRATAQTAKQVKDALDIGAKSYKEKGWI
ncbi:MAG TPA: DUF1801 domain-containing protein [Bacteroidia bacterium]|jgi:hypothetical protein